MALDDHFNMYNLGYIPYWELMHELKKDANAPKKPEPKTWFGRQCKLIGLKPENALAIGGVILAVTTLAGIIYHFSDGPEEKKAKVREFPTKVIGIYDIRQNSHLMKEIAKSYVHDDGLENYALKRIEELNSDNKDENTLIVPYTPDKSESK